MIQILTNKKSRQRIKTRSIWNEFIGIIIRIATQYPKQKETEG